MTNKKPIVCSFYTPDDYYANHAKELRATLANLGLRSELLEVEKLPGQDWADTTRRKIGFIKDVCDRNPDSLVFWIDVDCRISYLPDFVANSTADFIGFQRSFGSPLQIGYQNRTRFWEPSFWGLGTSTAARQLIADAYELEQRATIKATDDYFLEEAWRANAKKLTFQMIPSTSIVRDRQAPEPGASAPFFVFGSSGNVANFKDKVVQHGAGAKVGMRRKLLRQAKKIEASLPTGIRASLRALSDSIGITATLTSSRPRGIDPQRAGVIGDLVGSGIRGDRTSFDSMLKEFESQYIATYGERCNIEAAKSFLEYSASSASSRVTLAWWAKPFPGNFGDWLSPLVIEFASNSKVSYIPPERPVRGPHLFAVGSIGRFIKSNSIVVGTGISSKDVQLNKRAKYVSVRGPITAETLVASGGPKVTRFGDPGIVISRVFPIRRAKTNGRFALVRHFSHTAIPLSLPKDCDELSVMMSSKDDIQAFLGALVTYDFVVTSAMHVMIACHSYGIPCALVTFEGFEENVHGTGIKYRDYALGVGVEPIEPQVISTSLQTKNLRGMARNISVSEAKKDEVLLHLEEACRMAANS